MADKARKRKALFKPEELNVLLEEVEANKSLLFDRFKGALTNKHKSKKWGEIAERMTAVTGITRSNVDVRKKWQDFVSLAKKKASEFRHHSNMTGAGVHTAQALNDEEERAMAIIGYSASQGIPGGVDILAGITEEGDLSSEQLQEDEEPRIPHQSNSAAPTRHDPSPSKKRTKMPYENVFTANSTFPTSISNIFIRATENMHYLVAPG